LKPDLAELLQVKVKYIMLTLDFFERYNKALVEIHDSLSVMRTSEAIVENAAQLFGARGASLMLYEHGTETLKNSAAFGLSHEFLNKGPVVAEVSLRETVNHEPVIIEDAAKDDRVQYKKETADEGIKSIIGLPLKTGNLMVGALRLYFEQSRQFNQWELAAQSGFARQAGLALKKSFYFSSLKDVLHSIHSMPTVSSIHEILENLVESAARSTSAKACVLWFLEEDSEALSPACGYGFTRRYLIEQGITEQSFGEIESGRRVIIYRVRGDERIQDSELAFREDIEAIIGFPVRSRGNVVGSLRFYFQFEFEPDENDITYMGLLAGQVGAALEKHI